MCGGNKEDLGGELEREGARCKMDFVPRPIVQCLSTLRFIFLCLPTTTKAIIMPYNSLQYDEAVYGDLGCLLSSKGRS